MRVGLIWCLTLVAAAAQGIPVAFPGSVLSAETLRYCAAVVAAGGAVTGGADPSCSGLDVVAQRDEPQPGASLWDAPDG